jgi:hypothetical protein
MSLFTVAEGTVGITPRSSFAIEHACSTSPEAAWAKDLRNPYRARGQAAALPVEYLGGGLGTPEVM